MDAETKHRFERIEADILAVAEGLKNLTLFTQEFARDTERAVQSSRERMDEFDRSLSEFERNVNAYVKVADARMTRMEKAAELRMTRMEAAFTARMDRSDARMTRLEKDLKALIQSMSRRNGNGRAR
jgi:hypothetical protein